jgi:hypothetical protein
MVESVVFAGLKPDAPPPVRKRHPFLNKIKGAFECVVYAGLKPDSRSLMGQSRTLGEKLRIAAAAVTGLVVLVGIEGIILMNRSPAPKTAEAVSPAAPIVNDPPPAKAPDLVIKEIQVESTAKPPVVSAILLNTSSSHFDNATITIDLTDSDGMVVGFVRTTVAEIAPNSEIRIRIPYKDIKAASAILRLIETR